MQRSSLLTLEKLRNSLKKLVKDSVVDIYIIGSFTKNKLNPNDIDLIFEFNKKDLSETSEILFEAKEKLDLPGLHMESIYSETLLTEPIFLTILHEGFSVRHNKKVSELIGLTAFVQFSYGLESLEKIEKIKFSQTLYGRNKDGLLFQERGTQLGKGVIQVQVEKEEIFKELFEKWKIKYKRKRVFVND